MTECVNVIISAGVHESMHQINYCKARNRALDSNIVIVQYSYVSMLRAAYLATAPAPSHHCCDPRNICNKEHILR